MLRPSKIERKFAGYDEKCKEAGVNWTGILTKEIDGTYTTTLRLMDRVDATTLNWKPENGTNWMTVGQLLKHISNGCGAGCRGVVTGDWGLPPGVEFEDLPWEEIMPPAEKMPSVGSVEEARSLLLEDRAVALRMIEQTGESDLAGREIALPWAPNEKLPIGWHLLQMVRHLDRHKGQLFYYLKLQGVDVNTVDLWG